jgi:hypothetical protein
MVMQNVIGGRANKYEDDHSVHPFDAGISPGRSSEYPLYRYGNLRIALQLR